MKKYGIFFSLLLFVSYSYGATEQEIKDIKAELNKIYNKDFGPEAFKVYKHLIHYGNELAKNAQKETLKLCADNTRKACKEFVLFLQNHEKLQKIAFIYLDMPLNKATGITTLHLLAGFAEIADFIWCMEIFNSASTLIPQHIFPDLYFDINEIRDGRGRYAIHYAASFNPDKAIIEYLVKDHAVSVDVFDNDGCTPLHHAYAANNNDQVIDALIKAGAKSDMPDNTGKMPYDYRKNN